MTVRSAQRSYLNEFNRSFVYQASALFWVVESEQVHSSIEFLNYWRLKYEVPEVGLVTTLRSIDGSILYRANSLLEEPRAHTIEVADLLSLVDLAAPFEGSLEIEIHSARDIRFAYPALLGLYRGEEWQSFVHTYTRTLSTSSGDLLEVIVEPQVAEESNWSLYDDEHHRSFFVLHNGPLIAPPARLELQMFNYQGECLRQTVQLQERAPFATTRVLPGESVDLVSFLASRPGWMIARFLVRGILPRVLAGHERRADGALLGLTHSHYNSRDSRERFVAQTTGFPEKPLFISVPAGSSVPWSTRVFAYPTSEPMAYTMQVSWYTPDGSCLDEHSFELSEWGSVENWKTLDLLAPDSAPQAECEGATVADIILRPQADAIPERFHLGVEFVQGGNLPARFTTGFATFRKPRYSTYWFPVLNLEDRKDYVAIINTDVASALAQNYEVRVTIFRSRDTAFLEESFRLPANGSFVGPVEQLLPTIGAFLGDERGWCLLKPDHSANFHLFFVSLHTRTGVIAADHGF